MKSDLTKLRNDTMIKLETTKAGERMEGVSEYCDRRICSYLLNESVCLSHTGYDRMQKSPLPFLLPCHKVLYDGRIKLIYRTEGKISLCEAADCLTHRQRDHAVSELFDAAALLKERKYFPFGQLELETEKIYIDLETYQIYIIYLPVYHKDQAVSIQILEEQIKQKLEKLYKMYRRDTKKFVLQRIGAERKESWELKEKSFVIGKQREKVQCVVADSKALSRRHCILFWNFGKWWIMDLKSRNGTFLNKTKLIPQQWYALCPGDQIFAADCQFCLLYEQLR